MCGINMRTMAPADTIFEHEELALLGINAHKENKKYLPTPVYSAVFYPMFYLVVAHTCYVNSATLIVPAFTFLRRLCRRRLLCSMK
jgi:hypothetical protein